MLYAGVPLLLLTSSCFSCIVLRGRFGWILFNFPFTNRQRTIIVTSRKDDSTQYYVIEPQRKLLRFPDSLLRRLYFAELNSARDQSDEYNYFDFINLEKYSTKRLTVGRFDCVYEVDNGG